MESEQQLGGLREDWAVVERMLPEGWEAKARELGALRRARGIGDARTLLRVLLIHLSEGCSLRETAVRAAQGGLAEVSDVALLKRLRGCGAWFQWLGVQLMHRWVVLQPQQVFGGRRVRLVDGSTVSEPGATGSSWRIHYAVGLPGLECDEVHVTEPSVGESLRRYRVRRGELLIADRGFAHAAGVAYVKQHHADVIVRCNLSNLPLHDPGGAPFDPLGQLRTLGTAQLGDWPVQLLHKQQHIPGRVCALRKSEEAAERARIKAARESTRKGHRVQPQTLEAAGYTFVFTTLGTEVDAACVLEMYRGRWQIEIAFKRLKSLMQLGHLKKTDPEGAHAWLQGKLLVSLLVEALLAAAERFSPWGYPLREYRAQTSVPVAGDRIHA